MRQLQTNYARYSEFWDDSGKFSNNNSLIISDQAVTYSRLRELSNSVISSYLELSIQEGSRVILIFDRWDLALYPVLIACRTMGNSVLILPPATSKEKIYRTIQTLNPAAIFYSTIWTEAANEFKRQYTDEYDIDKADLNYINSAVLIFLKAPELEFDEAYIILSSGTTGDNKFISVPESALNHFTSTTRKRLEINSNDKIMHAFETTFDLFYFNLFIGLNAGATLVVFDRNDIWRPFRLLNKYTTNIWFSVPSFANLAISLHNEKNIKLPSLKYILFCGEPLSKKLVSKWKKLFPDARYENLYGPAELTIACSHYQIDNQLITGSTVPIGQMNECCHYLIRNERGEFTKSGKGELLVSGPQLMNGYLTRDKNHTDLVKPFITYDDNKYYATGDVVEVLNDGNLSFVGRTDRQFKYYGHIINPEFLEIQLQKLDGVDQVVIIAPGKTTNDEFENDNLHLYWSKSKVTVEDDVEIENAIRGRMTELMPKMKSVISYNKLESLPKTKSGKIDFQSIKTIRKDPSNVSTVDAGNYDISRQLLSRALNIDVNRINETSKIYDISEWDSLNHLNVVFELTDRLGYEIDPYACLSLRQIRNILDTKISSTPEPEVSRGLHGVILDITSISKLDKFNSKIYYRGVDINELINGFSFIDILSLLINSRFPTENERKLYEKEVHNGIQTAANFKNRASNTKNIENIVSQLLLLNDHDFLENNDKAFVTLHIIGFLLGLHLKKEPDSSDSLGKIVLDSFSYGDSSGQKSAVIEKCMILLAEHGACASTTTLRCVASTDNSFLACLGTALLTFHGKKHGGALLDVCRLLKDDNDRFGDAWKAAIATGTEINAIPGFGHRVYLKQDPRVTVLKTIMHEIDDSDSLIDEFDKLVENVRSSSEKKYFPNVDLATGFLFRALNIRYEHILMTFVVSRIAGWTAHYCEQVRNNTLIRPEFKYDHTHDLGGKIITD